MRMDTFAQTATAGPAKTLVRQFAPISGYPDYLASRDGRIFSLLTGRFMKPWRHASGHLYLELRNHVGARTNIPVHQLVLLAFVGPRPEGTETCHRDGNPENNRLANLYWGQRTANIEDYCRVHGRHWEARLTLAQAAAIRAEYTGRRGEQAYLAEKYGVSRYVINDIVNGKTYRGANA